MALSLFAWGYDESQQAQLELYMQIKCVLEHFPESSATCRVPWHENKCGKGSLKAGSLKTTFCSILLQNWLFSLDFSQALKVLDIYLYQETVERVVDDGWDLYIQVLLAWIMIVAIIFSQFLSTIYPGLFNILVSTLLHRTQKWGSFPSQTQCKHEPMYTS